MSLVPKSQTNARYDARPKAKQCDLVEERWSDSQIENLNDLMSRDHPKEILQWSDENFSPKLKFACSFGLEDVVILHIIHQLGIDPEVFFLDTGRLHQETYDLIDIYRDRFHFDIKIYTPNAESLGDILSKNGANQFYRNVEARQECCFVRKVEPLAKALAGADGWLTGIRQEQSRFRARAGVLSIDTVHGGILKVNPLFHWPLQSVWDYIRQHKIPYNSLFDRGYTSIGCAPCSRATQPGENSRDGRWWWENSNKECGLHHYTKSAINRVS